MAIATAEMILGRPYRVEPEQRLDLAGLTFDQYQTIADALPEARGLKLIFLDERLTFVTTSRQHDWLADCLSDLVKAVCLEFRVPFAIGGRATYRRRDLAGGIEGDQTFYFHDHARVMRGGVNIDLTVQPPPDLAIEVEVTHTADQAILTWGRLGVPEVWRLDARSWMPSYWIRLVDGQYARAETSRNLPMLAPSDIATQLRLADETSDSMAWLQQLHAWVRETLVPRHAGGA